MSIHGLPVVLVDGDGHYETVAASATAQALGSTGALGDRISRVIVKPATTSPGAVTLIDGNVSIVLFPGGASSVADLKPIVVELGMQAVVVTTPGWKITTGADVAAIAIGKFT